MKKLHVSSVSILFAALCLAFTACNQGVTAGNGTGTVRVVIGGETARAVDAAGMPVFDETNTKITVTGEDGTKLAEGTTSVTVEVGIGTKITVKAVVTTAAGVWRGSTEHTVTEGDNPVAVKLSKAPKSVGNILINVNKDGNRADLKLASGASLVSNAVVNMIKPKKYPLTARDSIGRIYVLYEEPPMTHAVFHFKRFDVEGKEDPGFESAITGKLPSGVTLDKIKTMVIDAKTNTVFVVVDDGSTNLYAYAVTETTHNTFTWSGAFNLTSLPPITSLHGIEAMAAYNNRLFLVVDTTGRNKLFAYKVVLSATAFSLEQEGSEIKLDKLRSHTGCTGLFADADGVYCLLSDQNLYGGNLYALGQIVRYQYSGSAFTGETKIGLNPKAAGTDGIPFDAQYFSAPVGFIGSDEENLYIADDGVGIQYVNENYHVTANKNRIAAFNRKTRGLTFTDTDATWYGQKPEYKHPDTKILLWERDPSGTAFRYWTSADGTEAFTDANKLFDASPSEKPTDIFCYDQDGNLYILWTDNFNYKVRRFELKNGTSYATGVDSHALSTPSSPSYIAVDISGGQNYLYCGYKDSNNDWKVERMSWIGNFATLTTPHPIWSITVGNDLSKKLTALAANKDGVFTGIQEPYQDGSIDKYRLKIQKYKKADGGHDSEITLVDNAVSYTNVTTEDPIADPGSPPNTACNQYQETINALQIANGMLYGISSKLHRKWLMNVSHVWSPDVFKHSSILYKIGSTTEALPNRPLAKKERPVDDTNKVGYGFYRFIAVKYDEAERIRLIIASDSAWGKGGSGHSPDMANTDTIVEFNLKDMVFGEVKRSDNVFSKKLVVSGFDWN